MSIIPCTVTPGKVLTPDALGQDRVTLDGLNEGFKPDVSVNLISAILVEDLKDITAALLPQATAVVGDPVAATNPIVVTLTAQDAKGATLGERTPVKWWLSDADVTVPANIPPTAVIPDVALVYTTGKFIVNIAINEFAYGLTDLTGLLTMQFQHNAGALTRYFYAIIGDKLIVGTQPLVWS